MILAIIAAVARNRVIGTNGKLPWHIPEDLRRFRRLTTSHTVLMGRRTFASIGRPLPNRRNVVLASTPLPGLETYPSLPAALHALVNESRVFVIGGERLFSEALGRSDELYLTLVHATPEGDAWFPAYEHLLDQTFELRMREDHPGFSFVDYVRRHGI